MTSTENMLRILFICTGNGGRSQMAAAFAEDWASSHMEIFSAGDGRQELHPMALETMREIGRNIPSSALLTLEDIQLQPFDVVVTLCNNANEICPTLPGLPARIHWPLPDPSKQHFEEESRVRDAFVNVRDEIRIRVESLFLHGFLDAVQQQRLALGSLLDNLTDGVLAHDTERRIFFFNQAAQKITGYDSTEVVGRDCHEVFPNRFCGGEGAFCGWSQGTAGSKLRYPRTFICKNGERRDLEMSVLTIRSPSNEQTGTLVVFRDLTEMVRLRRRLEQSRSFCGIVGRHASMQEVFNTIRELADVNAPILIQGESGTGKEMVATALHQLSKRSAGPFVPVNCGALPEGTLESELFGHVRGAFTGAIHDRKGRFALAEGGTIFLDEIGEISPALQVKLLRVIQEKSYMPVGGERSVKADVRVTCATNKDLRILTQQGMFRTDLFYRLAVMPIQLPPLREKRSDIPLLVEYFLDRFSADTGKSVREISREALDLLMRYEWPGNVRELMNALQYGMVKCRADILEVRHLPPEIRDYNKSADIAKAGRPPKLDLETVIDALQTTGGNRAAAARFLKVSRTTLYRFLETNKVSSSTEV
jgi:PAS domain S-box-containing protein